MPSGFLSKPYHSPSEEAEYAKRLAEKKREEIIESLLKSGQPVKRRDNIIPTPDVIKRDCEDNIAIVYADRIVYCRGGVDAVHSMLPDWREYLATIVYYGHQHR